MTREKGSSRVPLSREYAALGAELRRVRERAGKTTRGIQKPDGTFYRSGTVSNIEGGFSPPSVAYIKAIATLGGRYVDLMALRDRARRPPQGQPSVDDEFERQLLDPRSDPYLLRRGYVVDFEEDTSHIGPTGVPLRNVYRVAVRPNSSNARYFVLRYGHEPDKRRGVALAQAGSGCEVCLVDEQDDGTIFAVLEFDPTQSDELGRCSFSYAIEVRSNVPSPPHYLIHSRSYMAHIVSRIQFTPPAVPERIWWLRGVDPFIDRLPPQAEQVLEENPINYYFHEFYDVEGEACGLAWRWPIENPSR